MPKINIIETVLIALLLFAASLLINSCAPTNGQIGGDWNPEGSGIVPSGILFRSHRDGNWELYVMDADGSFQTRLTDSEGNEFGATWSPDGKKIAFACRENDDDRIGIYVMNADGTGRTRLTNGDYDALDPEWSPDGNKITFTCIGKHGIGIYVMDADGTGQTNLTQNEGWYDKSHSWSPDGEKIAFVSDRDDPDRRDYDDLDDIYVINADGTGLTRLTHQGSERSPVWSPDGSKMAFRSRRDGDTEIYVMDADGSNQTRITYTEENEWMLSWSPNSTRIAFSAKIVKKRVTSDIAWNNSGGTTTLSDDEIFIVDADGSNLTRLTYSENNEILPRWSPDGSKIAFVSVHPPISPESDSNSEIHVMNADGTNQIRLTNSEGSDSWPVWSPVDN